LVVCYVVDKGVVVHSSGRALYGYDLNKYASFPVAKTRRPVSVIDIDSLRGHVYWVDGNQMRRAKLNANSSLTAPPQNLCPVRNASGIAFDWVARSELRLIVCATFTRILGFKN